MMSPVEKSSEGKGQNILRKIWKKKKQLKKKLLNASVINQSAFF